MTTTTQTTETKTSGKTVIEDAVIAKIIGLAVKDVPGVHDLGGGVARTIGNIRSALNQKDTSQGVSVEVGDTEVAADIVIVAEYPTRLHEVSEQVRAEAANAITSLIGMKVAEINVRVDDVYIPGEDKNEEKEPNRVN